MNICIVLVSSKTEDIRVNELEVRSLSPYAVEGRFDPLFPNSFEIVNISKIQTTNNPPISTKKVNNSSPLKTEKAPDHQPIVITNNASVKLIPFQLSSRQPLPQPNPLLYPPSTESTAIRILTQPLKQLILRSFEGYRRLMRDAHRIEDHIRQTLGLSKRVRLTSLDPLSLPNPIILEHRDKNVPDMGKMIFTLTDISISGLSNFRVEHLESRELGRNLYFQHLIPHMDSVANYSVDYLLFDAVKVRVSSGYLTARVPNARIKGTFEVFPDVMNLWFRVAQVNLTTWVEDLDLRFHPNFLISEKFTVDTNTVEKIHRAFNYFLPNVTDLLSLTYSKAIEMRLT
jgi:hypothetical protein